MLAVTLSLDKNYLRGGNVDLALGVSITGSSVRLALVDVGNDDGITVDCNEFAFPAPGNIAAPSPTESIVTAVLGTQAIAAAGGHKLVSVGMSWHQDADSDAQSMLGTLNALGLRNIEEISAPEAAEALTVTIARAAQFETIVTCVVEPKAVLQCLVQLDDEGVKKSSVRIFDGGDQDDVVDRLAKGLKEDGVEPDAIVVLGSDPATEAITKSMCAAVRRPVITTPQCEFALARGAAFAAARRALAIQDGLDSDELQPKPSVFVTRTTKIAGMAELMDPVDTPPQQQPSRFSNIAAVLATLAVAVLTLAVASFVLITGDTSAQPAQPAKVEHRQVVETLVGSVKPAPPVELPPAPPPAAPPPVQEVQPVEHAVLPPQPRQIPIPAQQSAPPQTGGQASNPALDGMVRAMQEWWLAQQPPPPAPEPVDPLPPSP